MKYEFQNSDSDTPGVPDESSFSWYVSAEYRFNKWIAAGTYYTESYNESFKPAERERAPLITLPTRIKETPRLRSDSILRTGGYSRWKAITPGH